jgi:ribosomal protein S18 acetylase RimI-like enzyme
MLRTAKQEDVAAIVAVHMHSFPHFFLTFLGSHFLHTLYRHTLALPEAIGFVAVDDADDFMGFVVGVTSQTGLYRKLLRKHWFDFALASLMPAFRRPTIIPRLLRAMRKPAETAESVAECLLMSIAVRPEAQGQQWGEHLVENFLIEAQRRGVIAVSLTTDKDDNERVNRFYQRLGYTLARSFITAEGRSMNEYVINLSSHRIGAERNV